MCVDAVLAAAQQYFCTSKKQFSEVVVCGAVSAAAKQAFFERQAVGRAIEWAIKRAL
jgi:hypothetical protein